MRDIVPVPGHRGRSMSVVVMAVNVTLHIEAFSPPSATTHLYYRSMLFFSSSIR